MKRQGGLLKRYIVVVLSFNKALQESMALVGMCRRIPPHEFSRAARPWCRQQRISGHEGGLLDKLFEIGSPRYMVCLYKVSPQVTRVFFYGRKTVVSSYCHPIKNDRQKGPALYTFYINHILLYFPRVGIMGFPVASIQSPSELQRFGNVLRSVWTQKFTKDGGQGSLNATCCGRKSNYANGI